MKRPSKILEKKLRAYQKTLIKTFESSNRKPKVIIGVEHKNLRSTDKSGPVPTTLAPKLEKELIKIAPLGQKGHKYSVGCCCEVSSSNKLILKRPSIPIADLVFTDAIRVFSGQRKARCQNCKDVFG